MRGIILAAGRGSRLQNLTDNRPKCMVPVGGIPLLDWQLNAMRVAGIDQILVVRGYLGDSIVGDFDVVDNPRWADTHMVASLMCAESWLKEEPCLVSYADIVYPSSAITTLCSSQAPLAILYDTQWKTLWERRFDDPLEDAESFCVEKDGRITDIGRKHVPIGDIQGQYMGLLKFTPESITWVRELLAENPKLTDRLDMTSMLARLIEQEKNVIGVPWEGTWCEVDSEQDLKVAESIARQLPS